MKNIIPRATVLKLLKDRGNLKASTEGGEGIVSKEEKRLRMKSETGQARK